MRKWLALLGGVVLVLALVVSVKTLTMPSRQVAATAVTVPETWLSPAMPPPPPGPPAGAPSGT